MDQAHQILGDLRTIDLLLARHHQQQMTEGRCGHPFEDMTQGQGRIIGLLHLQPEIRTKDLSMVLGIRQQSLNELLKKLEKKGCIERVSSEEDRRISLVRLTEKGASITPPHGPQEELFGNFTQAEMMQLHQLLGKLIDTLQDLLEEDYDEVMRAWMEEARVRFGEEKFALMMQMHRLGRHERREHEHRRHGHRERQERPLQGSPSSADESMTSERPHSAAEDEGGNQDK